MRTRFILIAALLCPAVPAKAAGFPGLPGWTPAGELVTFDRQGLFQAIDGAAGLYLSYGFRQLQMRDFVRGEMRIALSVFDMGVALNAYGVYRRERSAKARPVRAGAEAAATPPFQCQLVKDRFYVKASVHKGKLTPELCREILVPVAEALPGSNALPAALGLLPEAARVPGSIGYTRRDYLGLGELTHCLHAEYRSQDGKHYLLFAIVAQDQAGLDRTWKRLADKWKPLMTGDRQAVVRSVPYRGEVIVSRTKAGLVGAASAGEDPLDRGFLLRVLPPP